jgi:hypothetical protein
MFDLMFDSEPSKAHFKRECKKTRNYLMRWLERQASRWLILMAAKKKEG